MWDQKNYIGVSKLYKALDFLLTTMPEIMCSNRLDSGVSYYFIISCLRC